MQNVFQSLQQSQRSASWSGSVDEHEHCRTEADSARTRQKDVQVADEVTDNTSHDGYGNTGRSQKDDTRATSGGRRQAGDRESTRVDSYDAASQSDFEISRGREERVDVEELRMIRAKFARMSTVFGKYLIVVCLCVWFATNPMNAYECRCAYPRIHSIHDFATVRNVDVLRCICANMPWWVIDVRCDAGTGA